jgi:carboxymethylenebutenolidase
MPTSRTVSFRSNNRNLEAYLARPEGEGPFPGVVVIHEAFGLNDNIKAIADRFASEGYVALAVDLFAGRNRALCMARFMGGMLLRSFDNRGIRDLKTALSVLAEQPGVDDARLGPSASAWAAVSPSPGPAPMIAYARLLRSTA